MIYEYPEPEQPIRQGDIFVGVPRVEISLREVVLIDDDEERIAAWHEIAAKKDASALIVPVRSVAAIVVTQDCDALRSRDITLCEIRPFKDVERKATETTTAKAWMRNLTQQARINQKWFYLPPDERVGFTDKMGVDLKVTLCLPLEHLLELRRLRVGRLIPIADEHFRERISEFFRRYPYDEWYPLNEAELAEYQKAYPDTEPYPWQRKTR